MVTLKQLDGSNFDLTVGNSDLPLLVDFYADWCGPCKALTPTLEAISADAEGALSVVKVDIDTNPELASRYGIQSLPTVVVFQNGEVAGRVTGLVSRDELERQLGALLERSQVTK